MSFFFFADSAFPDSVFVTIISLLVPLALGHICLCGYWLGWLVLMCSDRWGIGSGEERLLITWGSSVGASARLSAAGWGLTSSANRRLARESHPSRHQEMARAKLSLAKSPTVSSPVLSSGNFRWWTVSRAEPCWRSSESCHASGHITLSQDS